jgi:NAD(P)-dependent dehydrogenase (short-subunit alcohol dehydrogenase family)
VKSDLVKAGRQIEITVNPSAAAMAGGPLVYEAGDITSSDFRRRLVDAATRQLGGLDLVVAAAGSGAIGRFRDASSDTLARIMDVDFTAQAELVRATLPALRVEDECGGQGQHRQSSGGRGVGVDVDFHV